MDLSSWLIDPVGLRRSVEDEKIRENFAQQICDQVVDNFGLKVPSLRVGCEFTGQ